MLSSRKWRKREMNVRNNIHYLKSYGSSRSCRIYVTAKLVEYYNGFSSREAQWDESKKAWRKRTVVQTTLYWKLLNSRSVCDARESRRVTVLLIPLTVVLHAISISVIDRRLRPANSSRPKLTINSVSSVTGSCELQFFIHINCCGSYRKLIKIIQTKRGIYETQSTQAFKLEV